MAQRLATEYVNATVQLTDVQMDQFLQNATASQISYRVKVLGGGGQEIVLVDDSGEEVHLPFERKNGFYVCELSCRLVTPRLTHAMQKLFAAYKGTGKVNRIYQGFIMSYDYQEGTVRKIVQDTDGSRSLVFEYKDTIGELQRLFNSNHAETEIAGIHRKINTLLDQRLTADPDATLRIDEMLREHNQRLFILEA